MLNKVFDTIYYSIYRLTRRIGHSESDARSFADLWMPMFFATNAIWIYGFLHYTGLIKKLPRYEEKVLYFTMLFLACVIVFIIYEIKGRAKRVIESYDKKKNMRFYVWLGVAAVSAPVWLSVLMFFVIRAITG